MEAAVTAIIIWLLLLVFLAWRALFWLMKIAESQERIANWYEADPDYRTFREDCGCFEEGEATQFVDGERRNGLDSEDRYSI